jgi:hypothetical protein
MVHVSSIMWRIKNKPSNSSSCSTMPYAHYCSSCGGHIILKTSIDVFIINLGLRCERLFWERYVLKGQITFKGHWRLWSWTIIKRMEPIRLVASKWRSPIPPSISPWMWFVISIEQFITFHNEKNGVFWWSVLHETVVGNDWCGWDLDEVDKSCTHYKGHFTIWPKVKRPWISTNHIARNQEFSLLTLHIRGRSLKIVAFQNAYMAIFFD